MEFKTAKLDTFAKVITAFIIILTLVLVFPLIATEFDWWLLFAVILLVITIIFCYLLVPTIILQEEKLIIKNHLTKIIIPINSKTKINRILGDSFFGNIRTFGVGGVFGYFGYFNGNHIWYVTDSNKKIKIVYNGKTYVISPENTELFLKEINKMRISEAVN